MKYPNKNIGKWEGNAAPPDGPPTHEFYVDLGSLTVEAESEEHAKEIASEMIGSGEHTVEIVGVGREDIEG